MTEQMIRTAYAGMRPLPGAEERIWEEIDKKLRRRGSTLFVQYGKRRDPLPALLAAALVLALTLLTVLLLRRTPVERGEDSLSIAPIGETEIAPIVREIKLVNTLVDGKSVLQIREDGRFLARVVLPEGMAVDHWLVNGEPVDAGDRLFSLEFDSADVREVEAVLREAKTVRCGANAYIQFPDQELDPGGVKYDQISFEFDYTVPLTGKEHDGGTITAWVLPVIPVGMELDYWLIDGEPVEAEEPARGILLKNLDRSITVDAVLKEGSKLIPEGESLVLRGESQGTTRRPADDLPAGVTAAPGNAPWIETDIFKDGVPFDPTLPAPDGHVHHWGFENYWPQDDLFGFRYVELHICTKCGWEYTVDDKFNGRCTLVNHGDADSSTPDTEPPDEEAEALAAALQIQLVNARVYGESSQRSVEEGRFLARAVLPEGMAVDHWLVNGEPVDAGNRLFSLEFDSAGVREIEAVLREAKTVRCGENVYLQFLDEEGEVGWMKYETVCFELDYVVPTTGQTHAGGSITAKVLPIVPWNMEIDYWIIDGERVDAEVLPDSILLQDLDRSVTIDVVLKEGWWHPPTGEIYTLQGSSAGTVSRPEDDRPEDDRPAGASEQPKNPEWPRIDDTRVGVPFDPVAPASDGHVHQWAEVGRYREYNYETNQYTGADIVVYWCMTCYRRYEVQVFP